MRKLIAFGALALLALAGVFVLASRRVGPGRVEDWRAHGRVRWVPQGFRPGPQSGSHSHVSSPRHVKRSMRISRTTLSCPLHIKGYVTYRVRAAFDGGCRRLTR